jgi:hypothetical protein
MVFRDINYKPHRHTVNTPGQQALLLENRAFGRGANNPVAQFSGPESLQCHDTAVVVPTVTVNSESFQPFGTLKSHFFRLRGDSVFHSVSHADSVEPKIARAG